MSISRLCLWATILFAVFTLLMSGAMSGWDLTGDPGANGYARSIFALYFAQDLDQLAFLAGDENAARRAELMRVQALDMYYPFIYAGMAMLFFAGIGLRGVKLAWLGLILAAAAIGADLAENEVANRVLADLEAGADPTERLDALWGHSWIKWGFIGAYAAVMAAIMILDRRRLLAIFPLLAAFGVLASWLQGGAPDYFNWAYQLLVPFMLTFPVAAWIYKGEAD